jgi:hypothetical protein
MATMTKSAKGKVALFTEVPPQLKAEMERLAELHNRSVTGEVITALQEYIARHRAAEDAERQQKKGGGR